jgi:hypothetical protein
MSEEVFRNRISIEIGEFLDKKYKVEVSKKLLYKVIVDEDLEYIPASPSTPKKGEYAFETDIAIVKGKIPLVVIETKFGGFSTHDILTYSTKAIKHKEIYPYLRYGLLVGDKPNITNKFFLHNVGFDFAMAMKTISTDNINQLKSIIETQIASAELLLSIMKDKKGKGVATFNSVLSKT